MSNVRKVVVHLKIQITKIPKIKYLFGDLRVALVSRAAQVANAKDSAASRCTT